MIVNTLCKDVLFRLQAVSWSGPWASFCVGFSIMVLIVNIDRMINNFEVKYFKITAANCCFLVPGNNW